MMKKLLLYFVLLLMAGNALAAYSPETIIADPTGGYEMAVKAASTAPLSTDPAGVVSLSPNGNAVTISSSALPTGASTAANQSTMITDLATINTTLGTPMQNTGGSVTANAGTNLNTSALALESGGHLNAIDTVQGAKADAAATDSTSAWSVVAILKGLWAKLATINTTLGSPFQAGGSIGNTVFGATESGTWNITNISGTVSLPTGASTSALQTTANTSLATIATNSGKIPPNSTAAFSQTSVTTTASTVSAPANAVRVLIQGDSSNTDCVRYRFDGTAATATVGMVAQPGQDSGQLDSGMSVSVAACSGTQKVNVQYLAQ